MAFPREWKYDIKLISIKEVEMKTKEEIGRRIRTFYADVISHGNGTLLGFSDAGAMTDDDISDELVAAYRALLSMVKEEHQDVDDEHARMIVQAQLESRFQCTYEELFEYFIRDNDLSSPRLRRFLSSFKFI